MKFSKSAPLVLITASVIVIAVVSIVSTAISRSMSDSFADQQFVLMEKIVNSKFSGAERIAISAAEAMAAMPGRFASKISIQVRPARILQV